MKDGEIEAEKQRILKQFRLGITEYYMALDNLQADMPGFNLDVATDIHPHLADYTSPAGHEQLKTWQNLYAQLEEKPRYTVVRRYSTQRNSYHGLATGLEVSVAHAWLEVYEDLTPDDISFEHDKETGEKFVSINKFANATHPEGSNEPTRLYSTDVPRSIFNNNETIAHAQKPEFFFYIDEADLLMRGGDFKWVAETNSYLPVSLDDELRSLVSLRLEAEKPIEQ